MELERQKNVATIIAFPILDKNGDRISGAANLDSEYSYWSDSATPSSFADLTNEATEIGTTGIYYLQLTATEMNNDYIFILVTTTSPNSRDQMILIRTMVGDPLNHATSEAGRQIDVAAGGEVGVDFSNINGTLDNAEIGDNAISAAKIATDAITNTKIAADAIGSSEIAANAIGNAEIADNAISAAKIATDTITADKIAADAIGSSELATDAIGSDQLATTAVNEIVDQVWDELLADHNTALTMGANQNLIDDIKAKTDNLPVDPTSETNATANKNEIVTDIDDVKGTGFVKDTDSLVQIRTETDKIQTIDDNVDAIKAKTDNLPADPASETNVDAAETAILNDHTVMKQKAAGSYDRETDSLEALSEKLDVIEDLPVVSFKPIELLGTDIFNYAQDGVELGFWVWDQAGSILITTSHVATAGSYLLIRYRQGQSAVIDSGTLLTKNDNNNLKFYFAANIKLGDWLPGDVLIYEFSGASLSIGLKTIYLPLILQVSPLTGDQIAASGSLGSGSTSTIIDTQGLTDPDDYYNGMQVAVVRPNAPSSDNKMIVRNIVDFESSTGNITVDKAMPFTPTISDKFFILGKVSGSNVPDLQTDIDAILTDTDETQQKLPTNNIMGSSVKTDKDDEIDAIFNKLPPNDIADSNVTLSILGDTGEMQGKLPTNEIMGSSTKDNKDDEIDAIKAKTDNLPADPTSEANATTNTNSIITEVDANETKIDALQTDVTEALSRLLRTLALTNENVVMEHTYDAEDKHTGWIVWCYDSKTNADLHNKSTGLLYEYQMTVTYDANDNPTVTKIVRNP